MFLDTPSDIATLRVDLIPRGLLPAAGTLTGTELLAILQNGANTWTTISLLAAIIASNPALSSNINIEKEDVLVGTRNKLNFIPGANITLTIVDDSAGGEIDITISSTGGGGSVAANIDAGQGVVGVSAQLIAARTTRTRVTLVHSGNGGDVFVGESGVSESNGVLVPAIAGFTLPLENTAAIHAVKKTGQPDATMTWIEEYN